MSFTISPFARQRLFSKGEFLVTNVDHETIDTIIAWILNNRPAKKTFTLLINSSGGAPSAVVYFAAFLATLDPKVKIEGIAFGVCGSAALALLQCCHKRTAVKHCGFFIHHVNFRLDVSCHGYDLKKLEADLKQSQVMEEELVLLQSKRCGMSRGDWMNLADEGEQMDGRAILPSRALELRIVDEVVERRSIF